MYQKIIIVGNLGRDPEMRMTPSGKEVCNFSVATKNWKKETTWFRVTTWGKLAINCNQYLAKGRLVQVEGELTSDNGNPRVYQRKNGEWSASFEINASSVTFLGKEPQEQTVNEEDEIPF